MEQREGSDSSVEVKREEIVNMLTSHGVDVTVYGAGEAKPIDSLVQEVLSGETALREDENGELLREIFIATAKIIHTAPDGSVLRLKEDRQDFKDGRTRTRDKILGDNAIAEKLQVGESPEGAIIRAVHDEELKIDKGFEIVSGPNEDFTETTSQSYPGLKSRYNRYGFEIELDENGYNPDGYIEEQPEKTIYWVWVPEEEK